MGHAQQAARAVAGSERPFQQLFAVDLVRRKPHVVAVGGGAQGPVRNGQSRQMAHGPAHGDEEIAAVLFQQGRHLLHGEGVLRPEAADFGAAQGGQMSAAAQSPAQIVSQGADIGALTAAHLQPSPGMGTVFRKIQQLYFVDHHGPGLGPDLFAAAHFFIERFAAALDGGHGRRGLHDAAAKAGQQLRDSLRRQGGSVALPCSLALAVIAVGGNAKGHFSDIALFLPHDELGQAGGPAHGYGQHAGGRRVQGAAVADLEAVESRPQQAFQLRHHVVGAEAGGFVDVDESVHLTEQLSRFFQHGGHDLRKTAGLLAA